MSCYPIHFEESIEKKEWVEAMNEEIVAINSNDTCSLVVLLEGKRNVAMKLVYNTKFNQKGKIEKLKNKLVVKGFVQHPELDYEKSFSSGASLDTMRIKLEIATKNQ